MKILIIGGGGREHALAWKVAQSNNVEHVFAAPGNAGTHLEDKVRNVNIAAEDIPGLKDFALKNKIDLTIVGPEAPLCMGVVDQFEAANLKCFGPSASAAELEGSKTFAKNFMFRHGIPTAASETFTETEPAIEWIKNKGAPIVVKADGLAAGKGVVISQTEDEAIQAVESMLAGNVFGEAGHSVVIEEFLTGEEASFIVMTDGKTILPLATSQDHKARDEGDTGPNTGGMGAYSPAPVVTPELHDRIMSDVIKPVVDGMAAEDCTYKGFLYAGIMVAEDGTPNVLEFNCRFGDPETQPIMMRLKSDLALLCEAAVDGELEGKTAEWDPRSALGVVLAAGGYPDSPRKGDLIKGLRSDQNDQLFVKVFHAGTTDKSGDIVTSGGRVLCVSALGDSVKEAQQKAYTKVDEISWDGMFYRKDIGHKAIKREG
ncbi:MAG: phosphoribosylamine--glycine ligase [Gammaproteobacteria bacterium]